MADLIRGYRERVQLTQGGHSGADIGGISSSQPQKRPHPLKGIHVGKVDIGWSGGSAHFILAATHAKLGRVDAAKAAAARVLELQPGFTIGGTCAAFDIHPSIAGPLSEALTMAGLPE